MCGGGGGNVPAPDPAAEAAAQIAIAEANERIRRQNEEARLAAEAKKKQETEALFGQRFADVSNRAGSRFEEALNPYGVDVGQYRRFLDDQLARTRASTPIESDPSGLDIETLVNESIADARNSIRNPQRAKLNQVFKPNFEQELFADTADDDILNQILQEQYLDADTQLLSARERGTLNDAGYDFARRNLENSRTTAGSRLQTLGGDVLNRYRTAARDLRDKSQFEVDNLDFNTPIADFGQKLNEFSTDRKGRLSGDIRGAVGNERLFNASDLINRGGGYQGQVNVKPTQQTNLSLAAQLEEQNKKKSEESSSTGTF